MEDNKLECSQSPQKRPSSSNDATTTSSPSSVDSQTPIKSESPSPSPEKTLETKETPTPPELSTSSTPTISIEVPVKAFDPHIWQREIWNHPARFKQICWHRRSRKTTLAINKLIKECSFVKNRVFAYIAPTYKQAKNIIWRDPRMLKQYLPRELLKKDPNESELYCEFDTGSILQIRGADEPDSLRGSDYAGVVFDEWAMMKPEIWEEIIQPVVRANKGWAWFLFTPKGRNHAYRYWKNARNWPEWANFFLPVTESKMIEGEELVRLKAEMPEILYRQEFLCDFVEGAGSVFKGIHNCTTGVLKGPQKGHRYVLGVDLARTVDFTVIVVLDQNTNELVAFQRFNEISWNLQKEKITATAKKYNDGLIVIDASGVGDPIVEDLKRLGLKVDGFKFTGTSKQELIERLILSISQRLVYFPPVRELMDELESFTYEITPSGNFRYSAPEGMHDDCVIALALAVWGLKGNLYKIDDEIDDGALASLASDYKKPLFSFK